MVHRLHGGREMSIAKDYFSLSLYLCSRSVKDPLHIVLIQGPELLESVPSGVRREGNMVYKNWL